MKTYNELIEGLATDGMKSNVEKLKAEKAALEKEWEKLDNDASPVAKDKVQAKMHDIENKIEQIEAAIKKLSGK